MKRVEELKEILKGKNQEINRLKKLLGHVRDGDYERLQNQVSELQDKVIKLNQKKWYQFIKL